MKVRFECPLDFISEAELRKLLLDNQITIENDDPTIILVNPGTEKFLDWNHFKKYKSLQVVATPSTGTNHIDVATLNSKGIKVFCLLDDRDTLENIHASAEFTWIHIMNLVRKFNVAVNNKTEWRSSNNELKLRSNELNGKTIGIIGMGRIGKKIAKYASAFGLNIKYYDPYVAQEDAPGYARKLLDIKDIGLCQIISINCYLTNETKHMITWGIWDDISPGTIIVNTSRGEVVDEHYISYLVESKNISFGADVLANEQSLDDLKKSPLYILSQKNDNVVITPHVAGATVESQLKALVSSIKLSKIYLK